MTYGTYIGNTIIKNINGILNKIKTFIFYFKIMFRVNAYRLVLSNTSYYVGR